MAQNSVQQSQKRNYHSGTSIALGIAFGAALGAAFDEPALGVALGIVFGATVAVHRVRKSNQSPADSGSS